MSPLILAIAGGLVVVGVGLIALSGLLARKQAVSGAPDSSALAPGDPRGPKNRQDDTGGSTRPNKED